MGRADLLIRQVLRTLILLQVTCLFTGLAASCYFIANSYGQWQDAPVLTTIDSLAESVLKIQFPTVTICPDSHTPLDNWAPVMAVANQLKTRCEVAAITMAPGDPHMENCLTYSVVRSDSLAHIFDRIAKNFSDAIDYQYGKATGDQQVTYAGYLRKGYNLGSNILRYYNESVFKDLEKLIVRSVGMYMYGDTFWSYARSKYGNPNVTDTCLNPGGAPTSCQNLTRRAEILQVKGDTLVGDENQLGTYLSIYVPDLFVTFKKDQYLNQYLRYTNLSAQIKLQLRDALDVHSFMVSLAEAFGLNSSYNTSLFEIPSLLAPFATDALLPLDWRTQVPYTQEVFNISVSPYCTSSWMEYVDSGIAGDLSNLSHGCNVIVQDFVGLNLTAIIRLMKLTLHGGKSFLVESSGTDSFLTNYEKRNVSYHNKNVDLLSMIPLCEFGYVLRNEKHLGVNCSLFSPVSTDAGFCYAFNSKNFTDLYQDKNYFAQSFKDAFNKDFNIDHIHNSTVPGDHSGLIFYLDRHVIQRGDLNKLRVPKSSFTVSLNQALNPHSVRAQSLQVNIGYRTTIYVTPTEIVSDKDVRQFNPDSRNCRFSDEPVGHIFKVYTQSNCMFECMLNFSRASCGCTPWNYPFPGSDLKMCDMFGSTCFEESMQQLQLVKDCHCLPDCEAVEFKVTRIEERLLDLEELCIIETLSVRQFYSDYMSAKVAAMTNTLTYINEYLNTSTKYDYMRDYSHMLCKEAVAQDLAIIVIKMDVATYVKNRRSVQMTFEAQLGVIGGTLGLFTGVSLMTFADVVNWVAKVFVNRVATTNT